MKISQKNKNALSNPWMIGWLLLVTIVLSINSYMIITSATTGPGLVFDDYYQRGVDYEKKALKLLDDKKQLQWEILLDSTDIKVNEPTTLNILAKDNNGNLIKGLTGILQVYRPSDKNKDQIIQLKENKDGTYYADYTLGLKGKWRLLVSLKQAD